MASSRPNSGGRAGSGAEPMDWQPDPVAPKANIMVFTVNMSLREAEILLKVGLQREFNEHFKTDATIHADEQGVQIHIPYDIYKASKDEINKFLIGFRRHVLTNRKKLPFHIDLNEVLHLQTVYNKLFDAAANLGAHLEIDMDSKLFWIYALNEDILQNCMKSIQETVKEGLIKIDGIRNELEQDGRWLQFQESLKKQTDDRDFMVQIDGRGILIAGLCDSVEKVYEHLKSITDSLKNGSGDSKKIKKVADYQSQLTDNTSIVEVDFAVESYEAYDYLQAFLIPLLSGNISVKPYEKNNKFGFELVGPSKDIENADVLLKRAVEQMKHIVLKFEDNGYFATSEGKRFLEEEIRHGCKVLFKNPKEGYKKKNNVGKNHRHLSPTRDERDGHGFWRWTIQKGCHIILAESKADEMSAEVVLNMKETKSPDSKLSFQQKQSHQIVSVEVPKYTTGPTLDKLNERLRGVYQRLSQDKLQSVAMSLDCTGSWPIGGLVPKVIRSFSAFLLEKGKGVQLTLLLCSTLTDSIKKAKDVIQRILDEEFKKEENCKKVEPIQVRVVEGLLNKIEADILVNTTASDLDLSNGAVSRSLLKTAGKEMQDEIVNKFSRYIELEPGEITVTKGYKLKCQHVIHGVLEIVEEKQPDSVYKKIIKKFVTDCLEEADGLKCKTIAFPAVGTGRLEYPIDIVASTMFWAVHEFGEDHQRTTLKEVQFVIYPQDQEAIQVFKGKEQEVAEEIKKQQSSVDSAEVVFRFIGPEENIERAKQHIDDRLERLQDAQAKYGSGQDLCTEEINGISYINYELLRNFHMDTLIAWNQQGAVFSWKDEVLKIEGHRKNISVVKAYINSKLNEHVSGLSRAEVDVTGMDKDEIDRILERESPNVVKLYLPVIKAIVICGPVKNLVENEEKQLNKLKTEKARKSEQTQIRDTKEESSKLVLVDGIPEDIYMVMCEKYTDMHQFVIAYNPLKQTALVNKKHIRQFEKRVLEVKSMQKDALVIPDDHKHFVFNQTVEAHQANNVICVYQPDQSSVTVFGTDQTCIKEEIHKLKLKAHMIETTNRAKRELTTSFQAPMSPDPDDSWTMISSISDTDQSWNEHGQTTEKTGTQPGGARPKDQFARGPVGKAGSSIETFHTNEGIPVYVYKQDILKVNTDCIVNAANDTLKHGGGIARVISKAAGFSLDKECSDHIKTYGKLKTGKIYASNAGKLQYKCVIHAIGPCWSDYIPHTHKQVEQCKRDLQDAVFNSLMAAEKKGLGSIAIPAISSAIFAVPEEICTSMYAKGVIAYSKQAKPSTRLKEIHFVDSFSHIVSKIQQRFREMLHPAGQLGQVSSQMIISKSRQRSPEKGGESQRHEPSPLSTGFPYYEEKAYDAGFKLELHCHFSPLLNLIVDTGSVFEKAKQVDAVVCSDKKDGRGKGYIAKTLLEKGGHKYKMAAERAFKQNVKFGDVVVVKEEALGFKKVLIAIMWQKDPTDTEFQRVDKFRSVFKAVFQKAVSENCKSIVMPLMFTGEGKVKPSFCAERLLESCLEFSKEAKRKLTVYLINHEKWKTDTIMQMTKDYIDLQKTIYLSSRDQTVSQKPDSYKPTGRPDPKKGENLRSRQDVSRSQSSNQRPRGGGETNSNHGAMSSSFTSRGSRGSGSGSKFHDGGSESMRTSDRSWEHSSKTDKEPAAARDKQEENCVICMDTVNKPKKLKCGHVFCTDCIDSYFSSCKKVCPTCGVVCGVIKGDQPPGRMEVRFDRNFHCAGFEGVGTHVITYSFDPGKQGADHPNPGRPYKGITRTAFLPDTREGREVLKMLEVAFDRKLVFTIGSSRTTGQEGVITWNDIHHKTNPKPNTPFGYPDDGYLDRVKDELAVKGVTPEDIPASQRSK